MPGAKPITPPLIINQLSRHKMLNSCWFRGLVFYVAAIFVRIQPHFRRQLPIPGFVLNPSVWVFRSGHFIENLPVHDDIPCCTSVNLMRRYKRDGTMVMVVVVPCLLYTSDAADDLLCVDL